MPVISASNEYNHRVHRVLDYIESHISEPLDLQTLSDQAFFSPFHFHRIFTAFIGETPDGYIRRLRLEKAANMLQNKKNLSVTDIAMKCGFSSPSLFSRNFKKHFGVTPAGWKMSKNSQANSNNEHDFPSSSHYTHDEEQKGKYLTGITVKYIPAFHVIYVRHIRGYNDGIPKAFAKLYRWAEPRELIHKDSKFIGIYLDNPNVTPPEKCRSYACISVDKDVETSGEIGKLEIPGGKYFIASFEGKTSEIYQFYTEIYNCHLPSKGYEPWDFPDLMVYNTKPGEFRENGLIKFDTYILVKPIV